MSPRHALKSALMLLSAFAFAVLAGLHMARPVAPETELTALYAAQDICGYGEDGSSRDCPNCMLAGAVVLPGQSVLTRIVAPQSTLSATLWIGPEPASPDRGYHARAPPLFT